MSDTVIKVDGLSKVYQIGAKERHGRTFREAVTELVAGPWRRMRSIAGRGNGGSREETFWALKDVSFEVSRGEVVGIIGRNGAGKSTLLKVLSRITEPTSGTVRLRGRVASLLEVGTGFHPELTGRENIFLNGAVLGMKRAEIARKFDEIVAFAEVEKFLDTAVKRYSSGMYVRLAFAVAAHLEPEILIVDEVLAVGDAEFQKKCLGKMQDVAKGEGRTVLFVSHNMAAVLDLCSTCCVMQNGAVAFHGDTPTGVRHYMGKGEIHEPAVINLESVARTDVAVDASARPASFVSVELVTDKSAGAWRLAFGTELRLRFVVRAKSALGDLEIGPSIFDARGFEVASSLSSHALGSQAVAAGLHEILVAYPGLRLLPGHYYMGAGLRAESRFADYLRPACHFEVVATPAGNGLRIPTLQGAILADAGYAFNRLEAAS